MTVTDQLSSVQEVVTGDNRPIAQALRYMAGLDTDRASVQNDQGFNKFDGEFGHSLARQSETRQLTDRQIASAQKMLVKYTGQLQAAGFDPAALFATVAPSQADRPKAGGGKRIAFAPGKAEIEVEFPYDPYLVQQIKTIPGRRFHSENGRKYWTIPANGYGFILAASFRGFDIAQDVKDWVDAQRKAAKAAPIPQTPSLKPAVVDPRTIPGELVKTGRRYQFGVKFAYEKSLYEKIKRYTGAEWDPDARQWLIPFDDFDRVRADFDWFTVAPELDKLIAEQAAKNDARLKRNAERMAAYLKATNDLTAPLPGNPAIRLYEHQREAARFALRTGRALFAMDMGTGKTLAALAAAKPYADEGMEILVVCPASLKTNWEREAAWAGVPITVVSWHHNMIPDAPTMWPFVVIADEVHRAKNPKAQRTKKFEALTQAENCEAVILLTGTPMVNGRPAELFMPLRSLDHPVARVKTLYERRYCDAHHNGFGYDKNGATNLDELREKTADVIFRKRKAECLDLPAKTRVIFGVEITPSAQATYDKALREMKARYEERKRKGEISGADALAMLTFLRHSAALGTVESVIEGAQEIIEEGNQVILFTNFKDVAAELAAALDAEILSGDVPNKDRDPMVQRFQAGEKKAMILTYGAGGVGLTLTAANYVYLVDRPWTPGECTQAEDRAHRIGQDQNVTVIWPQAFGVNEKIDAVLSEKQDVIDNFLNESGTLDAETVSAHKIALSVIHQIMADK